MSPCLDEVAFQKEKEAGMGIFGFSHRRRPAFIRLLAVPNPDPGMLTTLYQRIYDLLRLHLPLCNTSGKSSRVPPYRVASNCFGMNHYTLSEACHVDGKANINPGKQDCEVSVRLR